MKCKDLFSMKIRDIFSNLIYFQPAGYILIVLYTVKVKLEDNVWTPKSIDIFLLALSVLQTKTNTCANSVDQDEMAHNEPSHLDLHCLSFYFRLKPLFASMDKSKFKKKRVHFRNSGMNVLKHVVVTH